MLGLGVILNQGCFADYCDILVQGDCADRAQLAATLNDADWHELGFVCDGRFLFSQRSLEQALLPEAFAEFAVKGLI